MSDEERASILVWSELVAGLNSKSIVREPRSGAASFTFWIISHLSWNVSSNEGKTRRRKNLGKDDVVDIAQLRTDTAWWRSPPPPACNLHLWTECKLLLKSFQDSHSLNQTNLLSVHSAIMKNHKTLKYFQLGAFLFFYSFILEYLTPCIVPSQGEDECEARNSCGRWTKASSLVLVCLVLASLVPTSLVHVSLVLAYLVQAWQDNAPSAFFLPNCPKWKPQFLEQKRLVALISSCACTHKYRNMIFTQSPDTIIDSHKGR